MNSAWIRLVRDSDLPHWRWIKQSEIEQPLMIIRVVGGQRIKGFLKRGLVASTPAPLPGLLINKGPSINDVMTCMAERGQKMALFAYVLY